MSSLFDRAEPKPVPRDTWRLSALRWWFVRKDDDGDGGRIARVAEVRTGMETPIVCDQVVGVTRYRSRWGVNEVDWMRVRLNIVTIRCNAK